MKTKVLQLGDPGLRKVCEPVLFPLNDEGRGELKKLEEALQEFRLEMGFGRAIAAPQIGIAKRFISLDLGEGVFTIFNPVITWWSDELLTLWDDCMSFPDLLVKVRRYESITVVYQDKNGDKKTWEKMEPSFSELLQHEIDHLDGILAIDRAIDKESIIYRSVFKEHEDYFRNQISG